MAGVASYSILVLAARALTVAENSDFLAFWSALFLLIGVLGGIQNESTRAVGAAQLSRAERAPRTPAVWRNGLLAGLLLALGLSVSSTLWAPLLFPAGAGRAVAVLGLAVVAYSVHATIAGAAAGLLNWRIFALLMIFEAIFRLVAVAVVATVAPNGTYFALACASSALAWPIMALVSSGTRQAMYAFADVASGRFLKHTLQAMLSAAGTSTLIVGFPVLLRATTPPAEYAAAAPLILAILVTRAPLLIPTQAFQGALISFFLREGPRKTRALFPFVAVVGLGLASTAGLAAWGDRVLGIFHEHYRVGHATFMLLGFDAILLALLTVSGAAVLAQSRHLTYTLGWILATGVSTLMLFAPFSLASRVAFGLAVGPICGLVVHKVGLLRQPIDGISNAWGSVNG